MPRFAPRAARTSLIAVLAAVLLLSSPALSSASAAGAARTTVPARGPGAAARHAAAKSALAKVLTAFAPKAARGQRSARHPLPYTDVSTLLRNLRMALPDLTGADRVTARRMLARPTDPGGDAVCEGCRNIVLNGTLATYATPHFLIHYQTAPPFLGKSQVATTEQVQATASVLENVYSTETGALGYRTPLSDAATANPSSKSNPDAKIDVFLAELGDQRLYGYASSDSTAQTEPPYLVLDNDFASSEFGAAPINSLKVTVAHEFFHAIQYAYDAYELAWFMEGTAVWMEDTVYPTINDYLQYLPTSQLAKPRQSTDDPNDLYGTVIFWKFLSERFKDPTIIRKIWERAAASSGNRNGIQSVGDVLKARGLSFAPEFARYGVWNTLPPGTYADRSLWPSPGVWETGTFSRNHTDTGKRSVTLNHLANAPLVMRVGSGLPSRTKLRVVIDAPNTTHGSRASVEIRFRNGTVKTYAVSLNSAGNAIRVYGFNPRYVRSTVIVLTNGSTGYDGQPFAVRVRAVA
ncbi:MAG: MXAN_6640 family putative metalloprotease [Marmoricola sp.]